MCRALTLKSRNLMKRKCLRACFENVNSTSEKNNDLRTMSKKRDQVGDT